jgi:hypothetical protein
MPPYSISSIKSLGFSLSVEVSVLAEETTDNFITTSY